MVFFSYENTVNSILDNYASWNLSESSTQMKFTESEY